MQLIEFTQDRLDQLLAAATTLAEVDEIEALWNEAAEANLLAATGDLRNNSVKFLDLVAKMEGHITRLSQGVLFNNTEAIEGLRDEIGNLHAALHEPDAMKKTFVSGDGILEVKNDEETVPGDEAPAAAPAAALDGNPLETPTPSTSSSYVSIADEYLRFFRGAAPRPTHASKIKKMADTALMHRSRYEDVSGGTGIPWWFVAGLHQMESTYNFKRHMHNGDPLTARTVRVPAGRPVSGNPPFTWEESCKDAMAHQKLTGLTDWSLARALWRWERYNGFGYRKKLVASPYLWSFSTIYLKGKYVADGTWDGNATSAQCGVAVLLKELMRRGEVDLTIDEIDEAEPTNTPDGTVAMVEPLAVAPAPGTTPPEHPFEEFFRQNLSDVTNFTWREFLFKGASHAANGLNTDPPEQLWPDVIPLARALQEIRTRIGKPMKLLSIYRSPAYNKALSGAAKRSQHMAFRAADFRVLGPGEGSPASWADVARQVRADGVFEGGIGQYGSFVHVDVRGTRADWTG